MREFYTKENMQGETFRVPDAGLTFEPAGLSFEIEAETSREGVIRVIHKGGKPARGYVYPSERCMRGVREQFAPAADGKGYIRWKFDSRGIVPGRTISGFFRVISPFGEYRIPYRVRVGGTSLALRRKSPQGFMGKGTGQTPKNPAELPPFEEEDIYAGIRTREDFRALAEEDFRRAAEFFYSSHFEKILTCDEDRTLYRGLSMRKDRLQNVEEFLISACGKEKTVFEPVEQSLFLRIEGRAGRADSRMAGARAERALEIHRQRVRSRGLGEDQVRRQAAPEDLVYIPLQIRKTGTGYAGVTIQAEGRFLPSAPFAVTAEEIAANSRRSEEGIQQKGSQKKEAEDGFQAKGTPAAEAEAGTEAGEAGQVFKINIPVNRAALHAGRNFGRVIVRGPFNETAIPVEVQALLSVPSVRRKQERELHLLELELMRLYVDYRLTDSRSHVGLEARADRLIDEISMLRHRDLVPRLYRVHMLILRGQMAEADRELSRIAIRYGGTDAASNISARYAGEQDTAYCYRQYLSARCHEEDPQIRSRVVRFLKGVYRAGGGWQTAWMLMDLSEEYAPGTAARWNFLRHQYENGCNSPAVWIDAWEMVREDPGILLPGTSVQERWVKDDFGLLVAWYAARNNVLTEKAAQVLIALAEKKKTFSLLLYRALCAAFESEVLADMRDRLLRAVCILLIRNQDNSPRAYVWYSRAAEAGVNLTNLEEYRQRSAPPDDSAFRLPAGCNAILRTTAPRVQRAVLIYDRFHREQVFPVRNGTAAMPVFGNANVVFLEDAEGNRYVKTLPYTLDLMEGDAVRPGKGEDPYELAARIGYGDREKDLTALTPERAAAAGRLLDSGLLTSGARTELLLLCLSVCRLQEKAEAEKEVTGKEEAGKEADRTEEKNARRTGGENLTHFFLRRADPAQCSSGDRAVLLRYLADQGDFEKAMTWLLAFGTDAADARLLGEICLGLPWEGGYESAVFPVAWEAFLLGCRDDRLLEKLSAGFQGLGDELCDLREACADKGLPTTDLDGRIIRQSLYSGTVPKSHGRIIAGEGEKLGRAFLPAAAQYADHAFCSGISMGNRMTDLLVKILAEGKEPAEDICRIACLKELSMRQGDFTQRERDAASASLSALLSKGIIFPFYRQFPGFDDRLDLYAEETLVQYHSLTPDEGGERTIRFHYSTSRRGETGSYRSRPMKEMYRDFFVSGFLLFYGEQMHYFITDDPQEKHVVQSGMIGQDARIPDNCSGRFGLINETTRAAALRDYDRALSLLTGYYRKTYLENELFRR